MQQKGEDYAVPLHKDNGLMLFLTPFQEHPLIIRNSRDEDLDLTNIGDDSVIVIIGSALPNWLLKGLTDHDNNDDVSQFNFNEKELESRKDFLPLATRCLLWSWI